MDTSSISTAATIPWSVEIDAAIRETREWSEGTRDTPPDIKNLISYISAGYKSGAIKTFIPILPLLTLEGKPYSLKGRFTMEPLFKCQVPRQSIWKCGRQVSKCVSTDELCITENGRRIPARELKPGDRMLSLDSNFKFVSRKVIAVYDNGIQLLYKITTRLGHTLKVTGNHPLKQLYDYRNADEFLALPKRDRRIATIRRGGIFQDNEITESEVKFVAFTLGASCCHPYKAPLTQDSKTIPGIIFTLSKRQTSLFLNILWSIGDIVKHHASRYDINFNTISIRLAQDIQSLLWKFGIPSSIRKTKDVARYPQCPDIYMIRVETQQGISTFLSEVRALGKSEDVSLSVITTNHNEDTIPHDITSTLSHLAATLKGKRENSFHSNELRVRDKYHLSKKKLDKYIEFFDSHESVSSDELQFLKNLRDGDVIWDEVVSCVEIGQGTTLDIEIEEVHNFAINGVVTHNSTSLAAQGVIQSTVTPYLSTLFVCPRFEQTRRLSTNYVSPFLSESQFSSLILDKTCSNNVLERNLSNKARMFFSYAFLDADRARGIAADKLVIDEAQDMDFSLVPILMHCMDASEDYRILQISGTPKTLDNTLQIQWEESSQAEWVIPCPHCRKQNIPHQEHDLLKMIGLKTVICARCNKPINPANGWWEHQFPEVQLKYAGYHVPQIILPMHYNNAEKWEAILYARDKQSPATFLNEVLGEACDIGIKLVTVTDIRRASQLGVNTRQEALNQVPKYNLKILSVDWGGQGRKGVSHTVASAIGFNPSSQNLECFYTLRLPVGLSHQQESMLILDIFQQLQCSYFAHDYGGGGSLRETLIIQAGIPTEQVIPFMYVAATSKGMLNYREPNQFNPRAYYSLDKARSLVVTITALKAGKILLPEYDSSKNITHDLLSLTEDKYETEKKGDIFLIGRNPQIPDDFAHSLNFGCIAFWHITNRWPDMAAAIRVAIRHDQADELQPDTDLTHWE